MMTNRRPDTEFVDNLEARLRTELARPVEPRRGRHARWASTAIVVVLALAVGFATATATQQWEDRGQRRYLIARAQGLVELAAMRLEMAASEQAANANAESVELRAIVQHNVEQHDFEWRQARLNLEEIRASGREVDDALVAPMIGERDFVTERLRLRLRNAREYENLVQMAAQRSQPAPGATPEEARQFELQRRMYEVEADEARQAVAALQRDIEARRAYLDGELDLQAVLHERRLAELQESVRQARDQVDLATAAWQEVMRSAAGTGVPPIHAKAVELQVAEAEFDLRMARLELDMVRERDDE